MPRIAATVLAIALGGVAAARAAEPVPAELAGCPGGAEWFAQESARRAAVPVAQAEPPTRPALRDELLRMEQSDQQARSAMVAAGSGASGDHLRQVDAQNLQRLKQIVASRFPTANEVGRDGVAAAWLLVQHADSDPSFQERMLEHIRPLTEAEGIDLQQVALLTDRVLLARGQPQLYGSQFEGGGGAPLVPRPVQAPEALEQRRRQMHLMPMDTYRCLLETMYAPAP